MKREGKVIAILIVAFMAPALTFAWEGAMVRLQGTVMVVDAKQSILTVNERSFTCNPQTAIYNEKGQPITLDKLKPRGWVYIEAVADRAKRGNLAKKIHVIPKYIHEKERHRYPFME